MARVRRQLPAPAARARALALPFVVKLVPFADHHLPQMSALLEDPAVLRYTRVPVPVPDGYADTWFGRYVEGRRSGARELFAAEDGGEFVGLGMSPEIDHSERTAELGYIVAASARGRGVGSEILSALTDWGFGTLGMLRLQLYISVANAASQHVARRCGYVREGVLRSLHFKANLRDDFEIWSRLPTDA